MKKIILSVSVLALLATASCKKDDDETAAAITPTVQNLAGSYKLSQIAAVMAGVGQNVTTTFLPACQRDDISKLNVNMTFEYTDAGTVCNPAGNYTSDWTLTNSTTIVIDGEVSTIRRFDGTNLELTSNFNGTTVVTYMVKQ